MTKNQIGPDESAEDKNVERSGRAAWETPALTRLRAADAEIGTRSNGPDGVFSVS